MKKNLLALLLIGIILLISQQLLSEKFGVLWLYGGDQYTSDTLAWSDAEGYYNTADSAVYVPKTVTDTVDDLRINTGTTYDGTADSFVVVQIYDTSKAKADTIMWQWEAGIFDDAADTAGITFADTAVINKDSTALRTGEVYIICGDSAHHLEGDRWIIQCYAINDRDTFYSNATSTSALYFPVSNIVHQRQITFPSASDDSMILIFQSRLYSGQWITLETDTITASDTTTSVYCADTMKIGPYYRSIYYLMGEDTDTSTYLLKDWLTGH